MLTDEGRVLWARLNLNNPNATAVKIAQSGGLLGAATEEDFTRTQGVEITVREDDGSLRAYVQAVQENEIFRVGERVRIMTVDGTSRVAH